MTRTRKHVLGIVGSPRKGGNTDILVDTILEGAKARGAKVEKIRLADLRISPCKACYGCAKTGLCVQKDDMAKLFVKMRKSGVWVIGTPVYWWGPSAQLKVFVDRWFAKVRRQSDLAIFKGKKVILAIPMGDTSRRTARHVIGMFKDALAYVGGILFGTVLAPGAYEKGEVRSDAKVLKHARKLGEESVKIT